MGKKIIYGDPRKMDLGNDIDILDSDITEKVKFQRAGLQSLYDTFQVNVPENGKVVNVKYVGVTSGFFVFDGGYKDYVRVENRLSEAKYLKNTNIGDSVDVYISEINQDDFFIKGSIAELYESRARQSLTSLEEGVAVVAFIREMTPAGYNIDIQYEGVTLPGFMPNTLAGINKLSSPETIMGQTFDVMIESFSREEGTYIVSRRKYLQTLIPQAIKELEYGKVYTGNVTGTTDFGVFVEFNECLTGMIHKTNIDPAWADKLTSITPGFQIEFYIKEIIKDKLILTQILRETLWDTIKVNQSLTGKVRDIKPFGALVILDEETNGLIHTSELEKTSKKVNAGDQVKVKVIAVDRPSRKIFLSVL
jgi:small subunit ribosomal protein S1